MFLQFFGLFHHILKIKHFLNEIELNKFLKTISPDPQHKLFAASRVSKIGSDFQQRSSYEYNSAPDSDPRLFERIESFEKYSDESPCFL